MCAYSRVLLCSSLREQFCYQIWPFPCSAHSRFIPLPLRFFALFHLPQRQLLLAHSLAPDLLEMSSSPMHLPLAALSYRLQLWRTGRHGGKPPPACPADCSACSTRCKPCVFSNAGVWLAVWMSLRQTFGFRKFVFSLCGCSPAPVQCSSPHYLFS